MNTNTNIDAAPGTLLPEESQLQGTLPNEGIWQCVKNFDPRPRAIRRPNKKRSLVREHQRANLDDLVARKLFSSSAH